jgi:hypothetical protein
MPLFRTLCIAALLPNVSFAQPLAVKPGLWEHQIQLKSDSGRIEIALELARTQMALLPPQQRQQIEAMIAAQGLKVDWTNQRFQNCVTEAEAKSGHFRFADEGGCTINSAKPKGNTTHIEFTCTQGQGSLDLVNGAEYTGQSSMTLNLSGFVEHVTATHSGHWVAANCAAIGQ